MRAILVLYFILQVMEDVDTYTGGRYTLVSMIKEQCSTGYSRPIRRLDHHYLLSNSSFSYDLSNERFAGIGHHLFSTHLKTLLTSVVPNNN